MNQDGSLVAVAAVRIVIVIVHTKHLVDKVEEEKEFGDKNNLVVIIVILQV